MRVDEAVYVATDDGGEPIGFNWRGIAYLVKNRPVRWFARREWWVEASRVQRGVGAGVVEVEMWRLRATPRVADSVALDSTQLLAGQGDSPNQFELIKNDENNVWRLVRVWQ